MRKCIKMEIKCIIFIPVKGIKKIQSIQQRQGENYTRRKIPGKY
jgi:hypothetical protein